MAQGRTRLGERQEIIYPFRRAGDVNPLASPLVFGGDYLLPVALIVRGAAPVQPGRQWPEILGEVSPYACSCLFPPHPSAEQLIAFSLGQLDDAEVEAIGLHVASCPKCLAIAQAVPGDTFIDQLKTAGRELNVTAPLVSLGQ